MKTQLLSGALLCAFFVASALSLLGQGSLVPSGTPTPTMKTLDQIEPRRPIDATNTPGNATNEFRIIQSGSYYLTGNVAVESGKNGISVETDGVAIDLNGFTLSGKAPERGIVSLGFNRLTVRNGRLSGWAVGIDARETSGTSSRDCVFSDLIIFGDGISAAAGARIERCTIVDSPTFAIETLDSVLIERCMVRGALGFGFRTQGNVRILDCTLSAGTSPPLARSGIVVGDQVVISGCAVTGFRGDGISTGTRAIVTDCSASTNGVGGLDSGIEAGESSTVFKCVATGNSGAGIVVGIVSEVLNCTARANGATGIALGERCRVRDSLAEGNALDGINEGGSGRISGCVAMANSGDGIESAGASTIENCNANINTENGIRVVHNSLVKDNACHTNGSGASSGAGIFATGASNRIEGNAVNFNDRGIDVDAGFNVICRNSARGNTGAGVPSADYDIAASNQLGPVGSAATATSPWANIAH